MVMNHGMTQFQLSTSLTVRVSGTSGTGTLKLVTTWTSQKRSTIPFSQTLGSTGTNARMSLIMKRGKHTNQTTLTGSQMRAGMMSAQTPVGSTVLHPIRTTLTMTKTSTAPMSFSLVVDDSKAAAKEKAKVVPGSKAKVNDTKAKEKAATLPMTGMNGMKTFLSPSTKEKGNAALEKAKEKEKENSGVPSKDSKEKEKVKDSKVKEKVRILLSLPQQP